MSSADEWVVEVRGGRRPGMLREPTPIITHNAYLPALADVVRYAQLAGGELMPATAVKAVGPHPEAWTLRRPGHEDVTITLTRWRDAGDNKGEEEDE